VRCNRFIDLLEVGLCVGAHTLHFVHIAKVGKNMRSSNFCSYFAAHASFEES
jgi:hypothetical protein